MNGKVDMLDNLMAERRSVRGFQPDPLPAYLIRRIFAMALQAPSNCNVQPWIVHVVSGASATALSDRLVERAASGAPPTPDIPLAPGYPGEYRSRQIDAAKALFAATGVARDDSTARYQSFLRNFCFFGAPHAAFVFMPSWAGAREAADCGMYAQSLMLAMTAHGVGSCAQGALSHYADIVHEALGVGDDGLLLFGIAFGYADTRHPANSARVAREPLDATTFFHS